MTERHNCGSQSSVQFCKRDLLGGSMVEFATLNGVETAWSFEGPQDAPVVIFAPRRGQDDVGAAGGGAGRQLPADSGAHP